MLRRLVTIDISAADLPAFERYELAVLALLPKHGGRLEARVRALDGSTETHLIAFPDARAFQAYINDPARLAARVDWVACRASSTAVEVEVV